MSRRKSYLLFPLLLSSLLANAAAVPVFNPEAKVEEITTESVTTNSNDHESALQCVVGDVVYSLGDSVPASDSCNRCRCSGSNNVTCEALQCSHKPGCRAIQHSDQCCPDYICECKLGERTYDNGERIPEEGGPCQVCYCRGGTVQCAVLECFWRDDCEPRYESGKCCPKFDHCPPPTGAPEGHAARPMNNSSAPEKLQEVTTTSELPIVKFQPVSKSENAPTESHQTTENLTEATQEEAAATTPEAPRTPTQDGGLVTESAVEAPSEPSSAPENLEARSSVTTIEESSTTPSYEEASTETPTKAEEDNVESRTVDDEPSTTEHEEVHQTESPTETTTIVEDVVSTVESSTEENVEPRFADEPTEINETTVESTTEDEEKTTEIAESMISTEPSTLVADSEQPIQSREHVEESQTEHNMDTTTLQSFTEDITTENSIEARTAEDTIPTTEVFSDVISTTDEITTENSIESRSGDSVVPLETSEAQSVTENSTPEITTETNKSVVELLHDSLMPAVNIEEEHELAKNLSSNMDPAAEETKVIEENKPSIVEELSKSIEKAEFPFNTTHNESSSTTESPGYLFNDSAFPESEFVDTAAVLSPLSHPLAAPQSYNRLNEWRIAAIQDPDSWRDEVDLAADPGAGADILILPWSQQHLRRRRSSHEDPIASYVHGSRTRRHL